MFSVTARNLVGGAEQKRPVNAEDGRVVRDVLVLKNVQAPVFDIVVGHLRNRRGLGHAADEEQRRQDHAGLDGDGQVGENGQREGDQPDADIGFGQAQQLRNLAPLAHVVGDDHQDSRQRRHRDVTGQRRGKQQHAQQVSA